jgi:hypothetical protein
MQVAGLLLQVSIVIIKLYERSIALRREIKIEVAGVSLENTNNVDVNVRDSVERYRSRESISAGDFGT